LLKDYKIRYIKKVTKTIQATAIVTAENPEQARKCFGNSPNSGVGKVIDQEIEITDFEIIKEGKLGDL